MEADDLREVMAYLKEKVRLGPSGGPTVIIFDAPTAGEMEGAGLNAEGSRRLLAEPWWDEMSADIVETPEMCDPDDPPEQVLEFARDVVSEYIRKRFKL